MKQCASDFALLGGQPAFSEPRHVAQLNLPDWDSTEAAFRSIFERRYFANNGPLVQQLDERFATFAGTRHAVSVTNGTMALMVMLRALELDGEILVPAFTFPATVQAIVWAGLRPVLCDVDRDSHMLSASSVRSRIGPASVGILGVHLWGKAGDPQGLADLAAEHGLALVYDACHGLGCASGSQGLAAFGSAAAFSFHATKIINGAEGGCIVTNDDGMAARLRTIRSFHGNQTFARVAVRTNAKMSEAQAALALLGIDDFERNREANRRRYEQLAVGLEGIPGVTLLDPEPEGSRSNYQYFVLDVEALAAGISRDRLLEVLAAENVICRRHFWPGMHRALPPALLSRAGAPLPNTEYLAERLLQLPNSQDMSLDEVERMAGLIRAAVAHAPELTVAKHAR